MSHCARTSAAENYWFKVIQGDCFTQEIEIINSNDNSICLLPLHSLLDSDNLLRVGGREGYSNRSFSQQYPIIINGTHPVTRLIISSEHLRLLYAGPTLLASSLGRRFHIIGGRKIICSVTRVCIICRHNSAKPKP